ncbi:MAG: ATP-binding cassette domain-containing protein [Methanosphaera sp.]|nr:ATP-binding cassette domain-containing protein [Methanosphaera sp.]
MIKVEHLTKIYKLNDNNMIKALDDVSFEVEDSEIYGIMGVSGSGKSTLLRILRGVEPFDEGKITINDLEVTPDNYTEVAHQLKEITAIHLQRSFGLWSKTVQDNVIHKLAGMKTHDESTVDLESAREEYLDEALDILDTVGLKEKAEHFAPVLSGGEKQRLVLARQIAKNPEILLLDEPATMSSPKKRREVLDTIKRINEKYNTTIILVSHEPEIQRYLSERVLLLYNGEVSQVNDTNTIVDLFLSKQEPVYELPEKEYNDPIIKVEDLERDFYLFRGGHVLTIEDINFQVYKGEILALIGPTGSGKSEILRMIAGFEEADKGKISILNNEEWISMDDFGQNRMQIRKNMGFMHQEFALTPHTTIINQIASKIAPKTDHVYKDAISKAEELGLSQETLDILYQLTDLPRNEAIDKLEKVNLSPEVLDLLFPSIEFDEVMEYAQPVFEALDLPLPLLNRQFIELSGGQKVRVAIATVLASNPDILILDEPFGDLDPITLRIVANSLKKINESLGTTIILVSHTMEFVNELATRTILLNDGKIVDEGNTSDIVDEFIKLEGVEDND